MLKKLNYKYRVFSCLFILTILPIIALGAYSYYTYVKGVTNEVKSVAKATVRQVKTNTDNLLTSIRKGYSAVAEQEEIKWFLENDIWYSNYSELVRASELLSGSVNYSDYIRGFTIINFSTEWVFSNRGLYKYEKVKNKEQVEAIFNQNPSILVRSFWLNGIKEETSGNLSREEVNLNELVLAVKLPIIKKEPYGIMFINVNMDVLEEKVLQNLPKNTFVTILDNEGKLVLTNKSEVGKYYLNELVQGSELKDGKVKMEGNTEYYSIVEASNSIDWTYIVSYDWNSIYERASQILLITLSALGMVSLVIVITNLLTKRIYRPVEELTKHVQELTPEAASKNKQNEFEFLTGSFTNLVKNNSTLERMMQGQKRQLAELFQIRLLRGDIMPDQINNYCDKLNIDHNHKYFIMSADLKFLEDTEEYNETKYDFLRMNAAEYMPEGVIKKLLMPPVCYAKAISLTVAIEGPESLDDMVNDVYTLMKDYALSKFEAHIHIGISTVYEHLIGFRKAHGESIAALKKNDLMGSHMESAVTSEVMFYSDITDTRSNYAYDRVLEREIKEAIDNCDKHKAFELVDRFLSFLLEHKVKQSEFYLYVHRFAIAIVLSGAELQKAEKPLFDNDYSTIFLKLYQIYDTNHIRNYIKYKLVSPIIHEIATYRNDRSSEIMQDIVRVIEEHDGDITLTECAEQLDYHPSYLWKIMKIEKNITFSDYLGNYKVEQAKKLLLETDFSVAEIAQKLNYTNAQNFIRFFSKIEGVTPGRYRQIQRRI